MMFHILPDLLASGLGLISLEHRPVAPLPSGVITTQARMLIEPYLRVRLSQVSHWQLLWLQDGPKGIKESQHAAPFPPIEAVKDSLAIGSGGRCTTRR
jgi:hypothetical protein